MIQLFIDCDGVLADFDGAFIYYFGMPPKEAEDEWGSETFWRKIQAVNGFYLNLPLMPDAKEMVAKASALRPIILTGTPLGNWAAPQKLAWARRHFPGVPMVTCLSFEKSIYCQPGDILIDDREGHKQRWLDAGGIWVTHKTARQSLEEVALHLTIDRHAKGH